MNGYKNKGITSERVSVYRKTMLRNACWQRENDPEKLNWKSNRGLDD